MNTMSTNIEQHLKQIESMAEQIDKVIGYTGHNTLIELVDAIRQELSAQADSQKYEGWSNYETWCYKNWIDSEQEKKDILVNKSNPKVDYCVDGLKELVKLYTPVLSFPVYTDLLQHSIDRINFTEIAEKLIEGAKDGGVE